jgi:hypothetical protein
MGPEFAAGVPAGAGHNDGGPIVVPVFSAVAAEAVAEADLAIGGEVGAGGDEEEEVG